MPHSPASRHVTVIALCLGVRLLFFLLVHPWDPDVEDTIVLRGDAVEYDALATALLHDGRFRADPGGVPEALRVPGYPLFVAACYAATGRRPWGVLLLQVVLSTVSCHLLMRATGRLWGGGVAATAGLLFAVEPGLVLMTSSLLSETLFVLVLTAALVVVCPVEPSRGACPSAPRLALLGLVLGLATLVRPAAGYVWLPVLAWLAVVGRLRAAAVLRGALPFLLAFAATLTPWVLRNVAIFGSPFISTSGAFTLLTFTAASVESPRRGTPWDRTRADLLDEAELRTGPAPGNAFDRSQLWSRRALEVLGASPLRVLQVLAVGALYTLASPGTSAYAIQLGLPPRKLDVTGPGSVGDILRDFFARKGPAFTLFGLLVGSYLLLVYATFLLGIRAGWRGGRRGHVLLLSALGLYFLAVASTSGLGSHFRYRVPVMVLLFPVAGLGMRRAGNQPGARKKDTGAPTLFGWSSGGCGVRERRIDRRATFV